jgi:hypothetical protein
MATKTTTKTTTKTKTTKGATHTGRPVGSGKFGSATKVIRVPVHLVEDIYAFIAKKIKT